MIALEEISVARRKSETRGRDELMRTEIWTWYDDDGTDRQDTHK